MVVDSDGYMKDLIANIYSVPARIYGLCRGRQRARMAREALTQSLPRLASNAQARYRQRARGDTAMIPGWSLAERYKSRYLLLRAAAQLTLNGRTQPRFLYVSFDLPFEQHATCGPLGPTSCNDTKEGPKVNRKKTELFGIRFTKAEVKRILAEAETFRMSRSVYIRHLIRIGCRIVADNPIELLK